MKKYIWSSIFVILAIFAFYSFSYAETESQSVEQLREKSRIDQLNIEEINNKLNILNSKTAKTVQQKNALSATIKELTSKRNKLVNEKNLTDKKINATEVIIKSLNNEIGTKNNSLNKATESLSSLLNNLYQQDQQSFILKLLSQDSLSDLSQVYNETIYLNSELNKYIKSVTSQRAILNTSKNKKEDEQSILNTLKEGLIKKEQVVLTTKKEQDALLIKKKIEEENLKKETALLEKQKENFEKSIDDYEAQIKNILNPNSIPKEGSNVLSWPLSYMFLTSSYGLRVSPYNKTQTQFHRGIDLRAKVGTPVKAMSSGVIEGTGNTDIVCKGASWGNWVFIKYNNGLSSIYGHLSVINVKKGDKVKTGDIIGLSGGTKKAFGSGSSQAPHLHVSVYVSTGVKVDTVPSQSCSGKIFTQPMITASNAYLDPTHYLPKF